MVDWRGTMNWPLSKDWECPTCGYDHLIWGFTNGLCRCARCHTEYFMKDKKNKTVNIPICQLKEKYKEPARLGYKHFRKPISQFSDADWDYAFELVKEIN